MGDAGIGHAFLTRARIRNDDEALAIATEVGDSIIARGKRNGDQLYWDHQVEMIFGASGTILFLLELGEETKEERFIEAALAASRWLIAQAKSEARQGRRRGPAVVALAAGRQHALCQLQPRHRRRRLRAGARRGGDRRRRLRRARRAAPPNG
jgi:lantibiotic modifying enzyme